MTTQPPTLLDIAYTYWNAGLTPVPHVAGVEEPSYCDARGNIVPIAWGRWKEYQPDRETLQRWFSNGDLNTVRIELLTGSVAHTKYEAPVRLQILDFESAEVFEAFIEDIHFNGHSDILYRCIVERTPSGGAHVGFLCQTISDKPKLKLALKKGEDDKNKLLIELLQHQLCTVAPTRIAWKPDRPKDAVYRLTQGRWDHPYPISPEQRQILLDVARAFNKVPAKVVGEKLGTLTNDTRPGDILNAQADVTWWQDTLTGHGWRDVSRPGQASQGVYAFQRPGKWGNRLSTTYGKTGIYLYVFSSNAQPFEPDTAYSPFAAYALLEHDGDFAAAAKALAKLYKLDTRPSQPSPLESPSQTHESDPLAELASHAVPTHVLQHPDRRVREHWKRVYRRTAILKQRLAREGALL